MPRYQMIAEFYAPDDLTADRMSWAATRSLALTSEAYFAPKVNVFMVVPLAIGTQEFGSAQESSMAMEKPRDRKEQGY